MTSCVGCFVVCRANQTGEVLKERPLEEGATYTILEVAEQATAPVVVRIGEQHLLVDPASPQGPHAIVMACEDDWSRGAGVTRRMRPETNCVVVDLEPQVIEPEPEQEPGPADKDGNANAA